MKNTKFKKVEIFRKTTDQWYPNYPGNEVRVIKTFLTDGRFRVAVWGADDFGMEIDVETKAEAQRVFDSLPEIITIADLECRGFVRS